MRLNLSATFLTAVDRRVFHGKCRRNPELVSLMKRQLVWKRKAQGKANSDQISWRVGFYAATEHRLGSLISWGDFIFNIGRVSFQNHSTNTYLKQKLEQALSKNVISECLDIFHFNYTLFKLHCAVFWCESMTSSQKEGNKWQNQLLIK